MRATSMRWQRSAKCTSAARREAVNHGGMIIAARTPDGRKAQQLEELMLAHGATQCLHTPDTGWTAA